MGDNRWASRHLEDGRATIVQFGVFEADLARSELRRKGVPIRLQQQQFRLLRLLLERPGELVTRDEIREKLWPQGEFVGFEQSISTAVLMLRRALRESADAPIYIETKPRQGYRFIAAIRQPTSAAVARPINAIAVFPFRDFSATENTSYFVDGFTDSLITEMARRSNLRVVPRLVMERHVGREHDLHQAARELDFQAVVEGSLLRSGDRVRITARLLHVLEERHLWAQTFERDVKDILLLEEEIVAAIVTSTSMAIKQSRKGIPAKQVDPVAHEQFLKGNFLASLRSVSSLEKAIVCYQTAIELEPQWAAPYAGLAEAYRRGDFSRNTPSNEFLAKNEELTGKALVLDPENALAHAVRGAVLAVHGWKWREGERMLAKALSFKSQNATIEHLYSVVLLYQGEYAPALDRANAALDADPSSLFFRSFRVQALQFARRFDEALVEGKDILEANPQNAFALLNYGTTLFNVGRVEEALPVLERFHAILKSPMALAALVVVHQRLSHLSEVQALLSQLQEMRSMNACPPMLMAYAYAAAHDQERAFEWLETAFLEKDHRLPFLCGRPLFDELRSDRRFVNLHEQLYRC